MLPIATSAYKTSDSTREPENNVISLTALTAARSA